MRHLGAIGDQVKTNENAGTNLSFMDSMKGFSRRLINRKNSALTRVRDYADDVLPSSAIPSIATTAAATARPGSGNADRLRWVSQKDRRKMECTRSNLG